MAKKKVVRKRKRNKKRSSPRSAFMKPLLPSKSLARVVGKSALTRAELTKRVWAYIKRNSLQDPKNRRMIRADDKLRVVFGKSAVNMFEMTRLISRQLGGTGRGNEKGGGDGDGDGTIDPGPSVSDD